MEQMKESLSSGGLVGGENASLLDSNLEKILNAFLAHRRGLVIELSSKVNSNVLAFLSGKRASVSLSFQHSQRRRVFAKVHLGADKDDGDSRANAHRLRHPDLNEA